MTEETKPTAEQLQAKALESLTEALKPLMTVVVRGAVDTMRGAPAEFVLLGFSRALAAVIGANYGGDDDGIRKFRERCRVEFSAALHQAPVVPLPQQPKAPQQEAPQEKSEAA